MRWQHYALCTMHSLLLCTGSTELVPGILAKWWSGTPADHVLPSFLVPGCRALRVSRLLLCTCFHPSAGNVLPALLVLVLSSVSLTFFGAWHQSLVEVWCETDSMFSFGVSFLLLLLFNPCLQDDQVSPCSKAKQHWALLKIQILLTGCVLLLCRACPLGQVGSGYMYNSSRILQYCKIEYFVKRHSTKEQSQWKYFRLETEYVARLEQLATKLEQEAKIIRGFLAKNYGHFDSRWSCLAPWAIILIFLETCFSSLLILIPIADCKQSQQILDYKFWTTFSGWIMIQGRGRLRRQISNCKCRAQLNLGSGMQKNI